MQTNEPTAPGTVPSGPERIQRVRRRARRRTAKRALWALLAVFVALALIRAFAPAPVQVDVGEVRRGQLREQVEEDGRSRVRERFEVYAPIGGNLLRIELQPGDHVEVGSPVARVLPADPALLDVRTRAETQARLAAALARVRQAEATAARARAAHDLARREADRARSLGELITRSERDRRLAEERASAQELAGAELAGRAAAAEADALRAILGTSGRSPGAEVAIRAPASGVVLRVLRESAGPVAAGTPLLELGDPSSLEIVVDVLSDDADRIEAGAPVILSQLGDGEPRRGTVRRIEPAAFTRVSALGVEEQRVNVLIDLDSPAPELGDGFRVEARIIVWEGEDVLMVPSSAVFRHGEGWAVFTITDGRAELRPIGLGRRGRGDTQVTRGLNEGDAVVLYPGEQVRDGRRIEPR